MASPFVWCRSLRDCRSWRWTYIIAVWGAPKCLTSCDASFWADWRGWSSFASMSTRGIRPRLRRHRHRLANRPAPIRAIQFRLADWLLASRNRPPKLALLATPVALAERVGILIREGDTNPLVFRPPDLQDGIKKTNKKKQNNWKEKDGIALGKSDGKDILFCVCPCLFIVDVASVVRKVCV